MEDWKPVTHQHKNHLDIGTKYQLKNGLPFQVKSFNSSSFLSSYKFSFRNNWNSGMTYQFTGKRLTRMKIILENFMKSFSFIIEIKYKRAHVLHVQVESKKSFHWLLNIYNKDWSRFDVVWWWSKDVVSVLRMCFSCVQTTQ